jgi:hypothetical protein
MQLHGCVRLRAATYCPISRVSHTWTARHDGVRTPGTAAQAMLEADPTSREPRDSYLARYQAYARDELDQALSKYDQLQSSLGESSCLNPAAQNALQPGGTPCEATANLQHQPWAACAVRMHLG